jgi:tol-pal system protein YbgF
MVGPSRLLSSLAPFAVIGALALTVPAAAQQQPAGEIPITAQLTVRISELEAQIRQLTGQIEDLSATVAQMRQRAERQSSDVDFRLTELEKARETAGVAPADAPKAPAAATPAQAPAVAPGAPPRDLGSVPVAQNPNAPVPLTPPGQATSAVRPPAGAVAPQPAAPAAKPSNAKEAYEQAFALVQKQDYPAAETAFRSFIGTYGTDDLAGNAQYWLGETYYVRGNYQEAAAQFFQGYQKYPKNTKAPDNLLKLGLSLAHINKTKEACASFNRFNTEYPQASAFLKRRVQEERARNNCGA